MYKVQTLALHVQWYCIPNMDYRIRNIWAGTIIVHMFIAKYSSTTIHAAANFWGYKTQSLVSPAHKSFSTRIRRCDSSLRWCSFAVAIIMPGNNNFFINFYRNCWNPRQWNKLKSHHTLLMLHLLSQLWYLLESHHCPQTNPEGFLQ